MPAIHGSCPANFSQSRPGMRHAFRPFRLPLLNRDVWLLDSPCHFLRCVAFLAAMTLPPLARADDSTEKLLAYPAAKRLDVVDSYHGVHVFDPYRWMEDLEAPETKTWIDAENKITELFLERIPARQQIKKRLTDLWNYEKYSLPFKKGGRYFYTKNDGLQNQSVLYMQTSIDGEPAILLDPNRLSEDGTIALSGIDISEDGSLMAYALSEAGSDWMEWRVRHVETGRDLADHIQWSKFSGASWSHDHQGFFYSRYDKPDSGEKLKEQNYYQKLYYHRLGTAQSEDTLIYERPDEKEWGFTGEVTEDGRYL
ncbi:MAG: hypothetical protein JW829_19600, partial [Pirellulales bacterium]|nr:hypothetical protein [Pirellulales bacterium]